MIHDLKIDNSGITTYDPFPKSWDATELACLNESCKIHKIIYCIKILNSDKFTLNFREKLIIS